MQLIEKLEKLVHDFNYKLDKIFELQGDKKNGDGNSPEIEQRAILSDISVDRDTIFNIRSLTDLAQFQSTQALTMKDDLAKSLFVQTMNVFQLICDFTPANLRTMMDKLELLPKLTGVIKNLLQVEDDCSNQVSQHQVESAFQNILEMPESEKKMT